MHHGIDLQVTSIHSWNIYIRMLLVNQNNKLLKTTAKITTITNITKKKKLQQQQKHKI